MKAYLTSQSEASAWVFWPNRIKAHEDAKKYMREMWPGVRIELVEVPTDKEAILGYLNDGAGDSPGFKVLKTWALTDRGGLREVPNGE